jgi:hypothetical protein
LLSEIEKNGGRVKFKPWFYQALENLQITDYAKFYAVENIHLRLFKVAWLDPEAIKELNEELEKATEEERTKFLDDWINLLNQEDDDESLPFKIPLTLEEEEQARQQLESLSDTERSQLLSRYDCFLIFFIINLHDYLSLMVHGRKITQLVTEAIQGNDASFVLAVQIDHTVMQSIPYFQARETRAHREGDTDFLDKLAYRKRIPPLQGKIRFRLLYLLFSILESMNLLDDLSHSEILDICDEAKLDRWQSRIEDVNYLTKRLREYRRFQQHKFIYDSMH